MIYSARANLMSAPVVVPADYVGMTSEVSAVVAAGAEFQTIATLGYNRYTAGGSQTSAELLVKYVNPSAPTFDANGDPTAGFNWTIFDQFLTLNPGKTLQMLLGFPADYLVSSAATGGASFGGKSNMAPTDLVTYGKVVTAIVRRAKNRYGITGARWTVWGEWDTTGDYTGTVSDMVQVAKVTYQAVKAADSTAVVIAPSISSAVAANTLLKTYLTTTDGAGGTGATWCDGTAMHFYQPYLPDSPAQYEKSIRLLREAMSAAGINKPVWMEECGILASDPNAAVNHARRLFVFAALGVKGYVGFSFDDPVEGYQIGPYVAAWNYAANALKGGPTMTACYVNADSTISAVLNGTSYSI